MAGGGWGLVALLIVIGVGAWLAYAAKRRDRPSTGDPMTLDEKVARRRKQRADEAAREVGPSTLAAGLMIGDGGAFFGGDHGGFDGGHHGGGDGGGGC